MVWKGRVCSLRVYILIVWAQNVSHVSPPQLVTERSSNRAGLKVNCTIVDYVLVNAHACVRACVCLWVYMYLPQVRRIGYVYIVFRPQRGKCRKWPGNDVFEQIHIVISYNTEAYYTHITIRRLRRSTRCAPFIDAVTQFHPTAKSFINCLLRNSVKLNFSQTKTKYLWIIDRDVSVKLFMGRFDGMYFDSFLGKNRRIT